MRRRTRAVTMAGDGDASGSRSTAAVAAMVRAVRPGWTLRAATPTESGTDALYYVTAGTPGGDRECVLKVREHVDPEEFRPEPYLLSALDRRTSVPVPAVVGAVDDHDSLPAPFFLMERCPGETPPETGEWPRGRIERVARAAGRFAGEYHALGTFERFGGVRLGRDVRHDRTALVVDGRRVTTEDGAGSWRSFLAGFAAWHLDRLDDPFADLEGHLRSFVEARLDALDGTATPALAHNDYRPWNLLLDPETGETTAVLDWGNEFTADPAYDLLSTEQHLSRWAPLDSDRRALARAAIREGYRERAAPPAPDERLRELYLAVTRLPGLVYFSTWAAGADEDERERAAQTHREYVSTLTS